MNPVARRRSLGGSLFSANLTHYYPMDEPFPFTIQDTFAGTNGTLSTGGIWGAPGGSGGGAGAVQYDGNPSNSHAGVTFSSQPFPTSAQDFSVEFASYSIVDNNNSRAWFTWNNGGGLIYTLNQLPTVFPGNLQFGTTIAAGTWTHNVFVYDNTAHSVTWYKNGSLIGSISQNLAAAFGAGIFTLFNQNASNFGFNGRMQKFGIYVGKLSASDATTLYNGFISGSHTGGASTAWTNYLTDTFTRADTSTGAAGSTTGAGNSWTDKQGGVYQIVSNQLKATADAVDNSQYLRDFLTRPSGENQQNQGVYARTATSPSAGAVYDVALRYQSGSTNCYLFAFDIGGNSGGGTMEIFKIIGGVVTQIGSTVNVSPSRDLSHIYEMRCAAIGISPTTLTYDLFDVTAGVYVGNYAVQTDSAASLQGSGGYALDIHSNPGGAANVSWTSARLFYS